jgi:hypothetical protein
MDDAVETPLDSHFPPSSESEPIQAEVRADIAKDRFYGGESFIVDEAAEYGIYLSLHLLGATFGKVRGTSLEEVDLSYLGAVVIAEALFSKSAREAVGFIPPELDGNSLMVNDDITPVAVQAFAGGADTVFLIITHRKVSYRVDSRRTMGHSIFFPRAFLKAVCRCKVRVAFPELLVGHVRIDTRFHEQLHVRFRMKAGIGSELGCLE